MIVDLFKLQCLDRTRPLKVRLGPARGGVCVISGCPIDGHGYVVNLPDHAGKACANCAADHGFTLRDAR